MTIYYEDWEELEKNHNLFMILGLFFFVGAKRAAENLFFNKICFETTEYSLEQKPRERIKCIEARCNKILFQFKEAMGVELDVTKHHFRYSIAFKTVAIFDFNNQSTRWIFQYDEYTHEVLLYLTVRKIFDYVSQYKTLTADEKLDMFKEVVCLIASSEVKILLKELPEFVELAENAAIRDQTRKAGLAKKSPYEAAGTIEAVNNLLAEKKDLLKQRGGKAKLNRIILDLIVSGAIPAPLTPTQKTVDSWIDKFKKTEMS